MRRQMPRDRDCGAYVPDESGIDQTCSENMYLQVVQAVLLHISGGSALLTERPDEDFTFVIPKLE